MKLYPKTRWEMRLISKIGVEIVDPVHDFHGSSQRLPHHATSNAMSTKSPNPRLQ